MGYGIRHLDGSSDDDAPISSFESLYDELLRADGEHTDVAVIDDDTGWCIAAYASGLVLFESLSDGTTSHLRGMDKRQVVELWTHLARGAMDEVRKWPWQDGLK